MEIGTGIFCGAVFLGLIYLFVKTRETWNWKKITFCSLGTPIVLTLLIIGYFYISSAWENRLQVVTSLKGITLGEKLSDVLFKNAGFEKFVPETDSAQLNSDKERTVIASEQNVKTVSKVEKDESINQEKEKFLSADSKIMIYAKNSKVISIGYICEEDYESTRVNGIGCGDKGEEIQEKYGNDLQILCSKKDKAWRAYDALNYGVRYILGNNRVQIFYVADKDFLMSRINWIQCE